MVDSSPSIYPKFGFRSGFAVKVIDLYSLYNFQMFSLVSETIYCILSNYSAYPYKRTVKLFRSLVLFLYFSVCLALRLPRLGKRAYLSAFRTFVRFALVWFCLFPLPLRVWDGLRLVIVALPRSFLLAFFFSDIISGHAPTSF